MTRLQRDSGRFPSLGGVSPEERLLRLKKQIHEKLIASMDLAALGNVSDADLRQQMRQAVEELCRQSTDLLSLAERERVSKEILDETFGLGPLEDLLRDPEVTDILVNGPRNIFVEKRGVIESTAIAFNDDKHLLQIIHRMVSQVGRRIDESQPLVDARLPDGSRINVVIPPLALDGPLVSIRRFGNRALGMDELIQRGALVREMALFLKACIRARLNVVISGGTGSGKTTLLNALSAYIPPQERIVTIEDAAELRLQQSHVARMETRPPNIEGHGAITTRDLVRNALRMRPDRIIVGECRGPEALDMLQAMNTGHDGGMTTLHANDTQDALSRLEMMVCMAGLDLPLWITRKQLASALHVLVHVARLPGGQRKLIRISEIIGMQGQEIALQDLFVFEQKTVASNGQATGNFLATGVLPRCRQKLEVCGQRLPQELFAAKVLE